MEEFSFIINDPNPVCISIGSQPYIAVVFNDVILQLLKGIAGWSRKFSAKQGVVIFVDDVHVAPCRHQNGF